MGLLHDLGKYAPAFQDYIAGRGPSPDHATAGAREIQTLASVNASDRIAALIGAYCIAGHHSGLPDWSGDRALSDRLKKELPPLDPVWQRELALEVSELFPKRFKRHDDKNRVAFQLATFGRMLFSCLVDADFRDTECFYAKHKGDRPDRDWPPLPSIVDGLIARFDAHMAGIAASASENRLNRLRAEILAHARGEASLPRGVFTLDVPTGGGKTLASLGFALDHAKAHGMDRIVYGIPFAGARIETPGRRPLAITTRWSLLARERGSKHGAAANEKWWPWSLLTRERGSKLVGVGHRLLRPVVAPHAGARIETYDAAPIGGTLGSLLTRELSNLSGNTC